MKLSSQVLSSKYQNRVLKQSTSCLLDSYNSISKDKILSLLDHSSENIRLNIAQPHIKNQAKTKADEHHGQCRNLLQNPQSYGANHKPKRVSSVLYVKGINPNLVTIQQLASLFGIYGRIEIAVMHRMRDFALIKYRDEESAIRAINNLNKVYIGSHRLSLFFSKYAYIEEKRFHNLKDYYIPPENQNPMFPSTRRKHKKSTKDDTPMQDEVELLNYDDQPVSRYLFIKVETSPYRIIADHDVILEFSQKARFTDIFREPSISGNPNCWLLEFASVSESILSLMRLSTMTCRLGRLTIRFVRPDVKPLS